MEETCTRCLILVRDQFTDGWNGIEMPDWSRVSSIELERTDDSSINSYNSLRDCCHRFVSLEQFQLPVSCGLFLQIFWKSQATRHKEQHSDTLHEIHFCKTWDSERSEERQWSTILITQVQKVCGRMAEFSPHNDKSIYVSLRSSGSRFHNVREAKLKLRPAKADLFTFGITRKFLSSSRVPLLWRFWRRSTK